MSASKDTPTRRSLRRFTFGSGPLKRRSDRIQAIGRLAVVLSFLVAPPLAVASATAMTAHLQSVVDAEAAERSSTEAILLEDAGPAPNDVNGEGGAFLQLVQGRATWSAPDGTSREGVVLVPPRARLGTAVPVWVDREGNLTRAPRDRADIQGTALEAGALPLVGVPLVTWLLYGALAFMLDARRERLWEQEWTAVEPDWNSRLM
jgi:hypothetical protein